MPISMISTSAVVPIHRTHFSQRGKKGPSRGNGPDISVTGVSTSYAKALTDKFVEFCEARPSIISISASNECITVTRPNGLVSSFNYDGHQHIDTVMARMENRIKPE